MECWIPEEEPYNPSTPWSDYETHLYSIFKNDFIDGFPTYNGKPVMIRTDPRYDNKEEGFWHLTCRDYSHKSGRPEDRDPDLDRCRRIRWPKAFIENNELCSSDDVDDCNGVMVWKAFHKTKGRPKERVKLFLEEEEYLVVLEERGSYYFLITAYRICEPHALDSVKREMLRNGAEKAGSAG